jgi:hypothetical protein
MSEKKYSSRKLGKEDEREADENSFGTYLAQSP